MLLSCWAERQKEEENLVLASLRRWLPFRTSRLGYPSFLFLLPSSRPAPRSYGPSLCSCRASIRGEKKRMKEKTPGNSTRRQRSRAITITMLRASPSLPSFTILAMPALVIRTAFDLSLSAKGGCQKGNSDSLGEREAGTLYGDGDKQGLLDGTEPQRCDMKMPITLHEKKEVEGGAPPRGVSIESMVEWSNGRFPHAEAEEVGVQRLVRRACPSINPKVDRAYPETVCCQGANERAMQQQERTTPRPQGAVLCVRSETFDRPRPPSIAATFLDFNQNLLSIVRMIPPCLGRALVVLWPSGSSGSSACSWPLASCEFFMPLVRPNHLLSRSSISSPCAKQSFHRNSTTSSTW